MGSHREGKKVASGGFPGASHVLKPGFRTGRTEHSTGGCHPHPMTRFLSFLTDSRQNSTDKDYGTTRLQVSENDYRGIECRNWFASLTANHLPSCPSRRQAARGAPACPGRCFCATSTAQRADRPVPIDSLGTSGAPVAPQGMSLCSLAPLQVRGAVPRAHPRCQHGGVALGAVQARCVPGPG